tara:strand:- start:184 stop:939 length:756 start_codon:yes stop_codon:yes gene_type:complete
MRIYYGKSILMRANITLNYSPNFSTIKRITKNIKFIIIHYTGMNSESKAIKRLTSVQSKVSCHYFIKRNGNIILMVPEIYIAWHAGRSTWKNYKSLNKYSIGIEIQNRGLKFGYQNFTKHQISSLIKISKYLMKKYKINKKNILAHSDISYNRKEDPGEKFPWKYLSKFKIGIWHNLNQGKLLKLRKNKTNTYQEKKMFNYLKLFGYSLKKIGIKDKTKLIKAFQRRFRPDLINGKIDKECLLIAEKISKY